MMSDPLVCAIMLTRDRPAMAARAVAAFRAQSYGRFSVLIYDTSENMPDKYPEFGSGAVLYHYRGPTDATIGALRNEAIEFAGIAKQPKEFDVFLHADDDDLSHPNRIAEQVALLQASGADCVGYNEVLFWRENSPRLHTTFADEPPSSRGEAWLYRCPKMSPAIGGSLCYWRKTWEARPFADAPKPGNATSEYYEWLRSFKVVGVSSLRQLNGFPSGWDQHEDPLGQPRLICSIHGGNSSGQYDNIEQSDSWRRVPEWDNYARERMAL
jgi:hypothetical protein